MRETLGRPKSPKFPLDTYHYRFQPLDIGKLMLPNPHDPVALAVQLPRHSASPKHISPDLLPPVPGITLWQWPATVWAGVPEATVDKHDELLTEEDEVRAAHQRRMQDPTRNAMTDKGVAQPLLGRAVAAGSYLAHQLTALFSVQDIHQLISIEDSRSIRYHLPWRGASILGVFIHGERRWRGY